MTQDARVGLRGKPFEMPVELGKVREFARAVMAEVPPATESAAISHATFLVTQAFWSDDDMVSLLGFDLDRLLHAEQEFIFEGPPPSAGSRLYGQSSVTDVYEKTGRRGGTMNFAVVTTEFRDASGRLVATSRSTGVETGQPAANTAESPA